MRRAAILIFLLWPNFALAIEPARMIELDVPQVATEAGACTNIGMWRRMGAQRMALELKFLDEFDDFDPNGEIWTPHYDHNPYDDWRGRTLQGNNEQQIYVDPEYKGESNAPLGLNPFSVKSGVLTITADKAPTDHLHGYRYTSGVITSRKSHLQRYGYFEIRARLPEGKGLWSAFWMLEPGKWPPEIDVFEMLGHDPNRIHMHVHWLDEGRHVDVGCKVSVRGSTRDFHSYGVLWTEEHLVRYVDRVPVAMSARPPGLDQPMYMLANLAVGGDWPGSPDQRTKFPARFEVDWIAAYQLIEPQ